MERARYALSPLSLSCSRRLGRRGLRQKCLRYGKEGIVFLRDESRSVVLALTKSVSPLDNKGSCGSIAANATDPENEVSNYQAVTKLWLHSYPRKAIDSPYEQFASPESYMQQLTKLDEYCGPALNVAQHVYHEFM